MGKITPEFWARMVDDMGLEKALAFVRKDGNEPPDGYEAQAPTLGTPAAKVEAPTPPSDATGLSVGSIYRDLMQEQQQAADRRRQRFETSAAELAKQRSGPSLSERLFQLSAAFASPTQTRGLSGVLGNVAPVLAQQGAAMRQGRELDKEKLRALREKYEDAGGDAPGKAISTRIQLAELAAKGEGGMGQWSDSAQQFYSKNKPQVAKTGTLVLGGKTHQFADMTNGNRHVDQGDGLWAVYDKVGNPLGYADAYGNKVDGPTS
jgi:hypothetical protein